MSITIGNMPGYSPISWPFTTQRKGNDFRKSISSEQLSQSKPVRELNHFDPTPLLKGKKDFIALGGTSAMNYAMWYAEESTEENPVIFARTIDAYGRELEQTFSLNDVDPHNATYLEMVALQVHYRPGDDGIYRYPYGSDLGPTDRMDFVDGYKQLISKHRINHFYDDASRCQKTLDFYMDIFEKNRSRGKDKELQLKELTASMHIRLLHVM